MIPLVAVSEEGSAQTSDVLSVGAGIRSKPKRALTVVISTVAAFILSCLLALIIESLQGENKEKTQAIKAALFGRKKAS